MTATSKTYDGNANIDVTGTLEGVIGDEDVELTISGTATDKNVGTKDVTVTATLTGGDIGNYTVAQPAKTTAEISAKELTVTDVTATSKTYDGNADIVVTGTLDGKVDGDSVTLTLTGAASDKNVGENKTVTVTASIDGADKDNYVLTQPGTTTATICKAALTITGVTATDREYDGTTAVILNGGELVGVIGTDNVTVNLGNGTIEDKNVGNGKAVTTAITLGGTDGGNYALTQPEGITVNLTAKKITVVWSNTQLIYNGSEQKPTASVETGVADETVTLTVSGAKTNAGTYTATAAMEIENSNYVLVDNTEEYTIAKADIAPSVTVKDWTYGAYADENEPVITGNPGDGAVTYVYEGTPNDGSQFTAGENIPTLAGNYKLTVNIAEGTNYNAASCETTFSVNKAAVIAPAIASKQYTGSKLTADVPKSERYEVVKNDGGINVGSYDVVLRLTDSNNYKWSDSEDAEKTLKFTIADVVNEWTQTPSISGWTYGKTANEPQFDVRYGKETAVIEYSVAGESAFSETVPTAAGNYLVRITVPATADYAELVSDQLSFTIARATLTVSEFGAKDREYDGTTAVELTGTLEGKVGNDDDVTLTLTGVMKDKTVGENKTVTVTAEISGAAAGNYTLTQPGNTTVTISAKELKITGVNATEREYDGTTVVALSGGALSGKIGEDDVTVSLGNGVAASKDAGEDIKVTTNITLGGDDSGNYVLTQPGDVTVKITARKVEVVWTNTELTYNGKAQAPTASADTGIEEALMLTVSGAQTDVGKYTATASAENGNYTLTNASVQFDIAKKEIKVVNVEATDREYDGTTSVTVTGKLDGVIDGDDLTLSISGTMKDKNVGNAKPVTVNASVSGDKAGNYTLITPENASVDITAKELTVSGMTATEREYDGTNVVKVNVGVLNGVVADDIVTFEVTGATMADKNAGENKPVTVAAELGGKDASNYKLATVAGVTVTITAKEIAVVWTNTELTYNGEAQTPTASADTDIAGETVELTVSGGQTNAGAYSATAAIDGDNGNYALTNASASYTIAKATYDMRSVKFDDKTVVYNGAAQSIVVSGTLPAGVTVTYSGEGTTVGEYTVTATFKGDEVNYNAIAPMTATLTITKATYDMSGIKFEDKTVVYNGAAQSIVVSGTLPAGVTAMYSGEGTNVGEYTVTATFTGDAVNYNAIADMTATLTIGKATYDMSGITFADKTVVENGEAQSIEIEGTLPAGVSVTYEGNGQTAAGVYTVTAKFASENENYNVPAAMTATLTLNVSEVVHTDDDDNTDAVISAEDGIHPEYVLVVERTEEAEIGDMIGEDERVSAAFNVSLQKDGEVVQADGEVTVRLRVPEEIAEGEYSLYALSGDSAVKVEYEKDGEFVVFRTEELTQFAFVVKGEADEQGSALWLIITLAAVVLIEIIAIALKKKKDKKDKGAYVAAGIFGGAIATYETVLLIVLGAAAIILAIYLIYLFLPKKKEAEETAGETVQVEDNQPEVVPEAPQVVTETAAEAVADEPAPVEETAEVAVEESAPVDEAAEAVVEEVAVPSEEESSDAETIPVVVADSDEGKDEEEEEEEEEGMATVRFNRSFTAKIILSKREKKLYFAEVANYILSYKKVKSRMSWKALTFNKGRTTLAKLGMRGKTLWLFLALNPAEFMETKYFGEDFSETAQYEKVPYGVKIKSERGVKFAKELVDILMQRQEVEFGEEVKQYKAKDYPRDTQENLIARGLIKVYSDGEIDEGDKLVAAGFNVRETVTASEAHDLMSDSVAMGLLETDAVEDDGGEVRAADGEKKGGKKDIINIDTLSDNFAAGEEVTLATLKEKGLISKNVSEIKVLARGTLNKPLKVTADDFSADAVKMIVLTGGKAIKHV